MKPRTRHTRRDDAICNHTLNVIARLDWAIQYAVPFQFYFDASGYWMPRIRGASQRMKGKSP
jgi:hypothetical protein